MELLVRTAAVQTTSGRGGTRHANSDVLVPHAHCWTTPHSLLHCSLPSPPAAITTFVGPPLVLPRVTPAEITDELITSIHTQYKAALEVLFNRYKGTFAPHRRLHFVGEPAGARGHARSDANKKEN